MGFIYEDYNTGYNDKFSVYKYVYFFLEALSGLNQLIGHF